MRYQLTPDFVLFTFGISILVLILFSTYFINTKTIYTNLERQASCLSAKRSVEAVLRYPGEPKNWEVSNVEKIGFSNGIREINYSKWLKAKQISNFTAYLETALSLRYKIYAFKPKKLSCTHNGKYAAICPDNNKIIIQANGSGQKLQLELYIPFVTVSANPISLESDDVYQISSDGNGSNVRMQFNVNDIDALEINWSGYPKLVFIKSWTYPQPKFVGNFLAEDDLGVQNAPKCNYYTKSLLVTNETVFLIDVNGGV